jgi:hypothetical protein
MFCEIKEKAENDFLKLFIWYEAIDIKTKPMSYTHQYTKTIRHPRLQP